MPNGQTADDVHSDLTGGNINAVELTKAQRLKENQGICFEGIKKYGDFDIRGDIASAWLNTGGNPNGLGNSAVLRPWINALDVVRRNSDTWIIDFTGMQEIDAALFEKPFHHMITQVKPARGGNRNPRAREQYWLSERRRLEMRKVLACLPRFRVTPVVSKHRVFVWRASPTMAMNLLDVIARSDDTTFGVLHSRFHELGALRMCT